MADHETSGYERGSRVKHTVPLEDKSKPRHLRLEVVYGGKAAVENNVVVHCHISRLVIGSHAFFRGIVYPVMVPV